MHSLVFVIYKVLFLGEVSTFAFGIIWLKEIYMCMRFSRTTNPSGWTPSHPFSLLIPLLCLSMLLLGTFSSVADIRNTHSGWQYLEQDAAQRGSGYPSQFNAPKAYPGGRWDALFAGIYGSDRLFLFGGSKSGIYFSATWLYTPPPANTWRYVDSSGTGVTKSMDEHGQVNETKSYPGGRHLGGVVSKIADVVYIFGFRRFVILTFCFL